MGNPEKPQPFTSESQFYEKARRYNRVDIQSAPSVEFDVTQDKHDKGFVDLMTEALVNASQSREAAFAVASALYLKLGARTDFSPSLLRPGDKFIFESSPGLLLIKIRQKKSAQEKKYVAVVGRHPNRERLQQLVSEGYVELKKETKKHVIDHARRQWTELIEDEENPDAVTAEKQGIVVNFLKALGGGDSRIASKENRRRIWEQMPDDAKQDSKGKLPEKLFRGTLQEKRRQNRAMITYLANLMRTQKKEEMQRLIWGDMTQEKRLPRLPKSKLRSKSRKESVAEPEETVGLRDNLDNAIKKGRDILDLKFQDHLKSQVEVFSTFLNDAFHRVSLVAKDPNDKNERYLFLKNFSAALDAMGTPPDSIMDGIYDFESLIKESDALLEDIPESLVQAGVSLTPDQKKQIKEIRKNLSEAKTEAENLKKQIDTHRWEFLDFSDIGNIYKALHSEKIQMMRIALIKYAIGTLNQVENNKMEINEKELMQILIDAYAYKNSGGETVITEINKLNIALSDFAIKGSVVKFPRINKYLSMITSGQLPPDS